MDVKLIVVGGKASKSAIPLKLPSVIGRSREADLTVSHPMVSRRHCEIFDNEGLLNIRDLGSLNGTIVDGDRIEQTEIRPNGEFTIGPLTFRAEYRFEGPIGETLEIRPNTQPADSSDQTPQPGSSQSPSLRGDSSALKSKPAPWSSDDALFQDAMSDPGDAESDTDEPDDDFNAFLDGLRED